MPTAVPLPTPSALSAFAVRVDLAQQVGVGDRAAVAGGLALPVERDLVAAAGLDVAVDAVVGDVELAAEEPLRVRRLPLVELRVRLEPGDALAGLALPERLEVLVVDRRLRVRLRRELRRRRVAALLEEEVLDRLAGRFAHVGRSLRRVARILPDKGSGRPETRKVLTWTQAPAALERALPRALRRLPRRPDRRDRATTRRRARSCRRASPARCARGGATAARARSRRGSGGSRSGSR